jgi:hypothetical protein
LKSWRSTPGGSPCIDAPRELELQPGESSDNELEGETSRQWWRAVRETGMVLRSDDIYRFGSNHTKEEE